MGEPSGPVAAVGLAVAGLAAVQGEPSGSAAAPGLAAVEGEPPPTLPFAEEAEEEQARLQGDGAEGEVRDVEVVASSAAEEEEEEEEEEALPPLPPPTQSPPGSGDEGGVAKGKAAVAKCEDVEEVESSAAEEEDEEEVRAVEFCTRLQLANLTMSSGGSELAKFMGPEKLQCWMHFRRMDKIVLQTCRDRSVLWALAAPDESSEIWHGGRVIRAALQDGARFFKLGITFKPYHRWANDRYGYKHDGFKSIVLMYVSENSDHIAEMETALIDVFRYKPRYGDGDMACAIIGNTGDRRCLNRAPGGEGAHHGFSPFFVYAALK